MHTFIGVLTVRDSVSQRQQTFVIDAEAFALKNARGHAGSDQDFSVLSACRAAHVEILYNPIMSFVK